MKIFLKQIILSIGISIGLIFILALIISKTTITENIITPAIISISTISITIGAIGVSKNKKKKGIINGSLLGIIYMFGMYIISSIILKDFSITSKMLIMIFGGIIGGAFGGIIGVNLKK